jgi:hypothetical protein
LALENNRRSSTKNERYLDLLLKYELVAKSSPRLSSLLNKPISPYKAQTSIKELNPFA